MGYKGEVFMDCGYFYGSPEGLCHVPPGSDEREIIPWSELLDDLDDNDFVDDII